MMTKRERVEAVLRGQTPDRPPVSFWHHFPPGQREGRASIEAHLRHFAKYDLDFLKVMDDHQFPRGGVEQVESVSDLSVIRPMDGDTGEMLDQLQVLRHLRAELGPDIFLPTTVFNAWATLRRLVGPMSDQHSPPKMVSEDERDRAITRLLRQDRGAVKATLQRLATTLADFSRRAVEAGASGIYLAVRDDWANTPENGMDTYNEMVRATDLTILKAVAGASFNVLHVCGRPQDLMAFAEYPVAVINWADRAAGPSIASVRDRLKPAIAAGVDNLNTLPYGAPEDVAGEVRDALEQAGGRPMLITPGCTYDPQVVPPENLQAMVDAAKSWGEGQLTGKK
jgi:uroporphyrinogen decarboxylase